MGALTSESSRRIDISLVLDGDVPGIAEAKVANWLQALIRAVASEARERLAEDRLPEAVQRGREVDSFCVRFVDDDEMTSLNERFRGKVATTDVLSFPGGIDAEGNHLGDVAISVPQAIRQGEAFGSDLVRELQRLLLHGVLHCFGYDHENDDGQMEDFERSLRARFMAGAQPPWSVPAEEGP